MPPAPEKIPNNVDLASDRKLQRALEEWLPDFRAWWRDMGPAGFQAHDVYLRTAVSVEPGGWAHFDFVKMPDYRWGIFLAPAVPGRGIGFGDHQGRPVWDEVPGELRKELRRIIVTQADTEPASVEQQRLLGRTAPSLYDLRNLFQVNVEEGRHLWAMVYLLHKYFGRDGREEADDLLARRAGGADSPRILNAFNRPIEDWLAFFCFTTFTDRDGKYQLAALAESGFDPLARTTQFMLTEEAHHMFVGETGVGRIIQRTCELLRETDDVTRVGGLPLALIQKSINAWYSVSLDLFGAEDSSNAATFFAAGLKGRYQESVAGRYEDHAALAGCYPVERVAPDGKTLVAEEIPLRRAMNLVLRDAYREECARVIERWNKVLRDHDRPERLTLPSERFHRELGAFAGHPFDPQGRLCDAATYDARLADWLPTPADREYLRAIQQPVSEPGKFASWIAPPRQGINTLPVEFTYVRGA